MLIEDQRVFINLSECGDGCVFDDGRGHIFMKIRETANGSNAVNLRDTICIRFKGDTKVQPLNARLVIE